MAAQFNSPPGWPTPPEGWTPPPGWSPDPSWPAAPEGWQFWTDDAAAPPPVAPPSDPQSTQTMGTSPTQVLPASGGPAAYSYAPSAGLDQPGASPYGGQGQPPGGYPAQGQYPPGGPTPQKRNTGAIVAVVVVAVLVLGGLVWGLTSLFSDGSDPDPTATSAEPSTEEPTSEAATSEEPTDEPTSEEPTSEEPTDDPGGDAGGFTDLTGNDPALVMGLTASDPIAELRLQEVVTDWQPDANSMLCGDPENGQYLGLRFELTTTDALAEEDPPTYNFIGWEIGAQVDGVTIETSGFGSGLFCLGEDQQFPSDMEPGQTYEGWVILDVPDTVTAAIYDDPLDFTGDGGMYRWVLADQ